MLVLCYGTGVCLGGSASHQFSAVSKQVSANRCVQQAVHLFSWFAIARVSLIATRNPTASPCSPRRLSLQEQAYSQWLKVLEKGIGETLEEAGFFDGFVRDDDDDDDDDDRRYGDKYTDDDDFEEDEGFDAVRRRGGRGTNTVSSSGKFSNKDVTRDNYDGGLDRRSDGRRSDDGDAEQLERGNRNRRRRRPEGAEDAWEPDNDYEEGPRFDLGKFLRSGADMLFGPAEGFEEEAER